MQKYKQGEGGFPQKRGWKEKEQRSFSEHSSKPFAGLRGPHPRLLSFHEESNQRRAKEEVSSLETPLRGKTAPLLSALSCFSVCGPENGQGPFSELFCRKVTLLGNFEKRSSLPLSAPLASKCQVLHLSFRVASSYVIVVTFLRAWGFKGGHT